MLKVLLAGQGGQGVLSAGRFLAECGLHEGKGVSYLPAYGPKMRGCTAICSVMDYFEIYFGRMQLCRRAADFLGKKFVLIINDVRLV